MHKKLLIIIFVIFILLELALHLIEDKLSIDIKHYNQMDTIVASISTEKSNNLFFLGNSLTRRGMDQALFKKKLSYTQVAYIYPDDTTILEWYWILKSKIVSNKNIKTLLISFVGHQLEDKPLQSQNLIRIASIVSASELIKVYDFESLDIDEMTNLTLAHYSNIHALKERINRRVLDLLPHYRDSMQEINRSMIHKVNTKRKSDKDSYKHLKEVIKLCHENKIKLMLVALPIPSKYKIQEELSALVNTYELTFIDAQYIPSITNEDYLDGYHLNKNGARKLTSFLIKKVQNKHSEVLQ